MHNRAQARLGAWERAESKRSRKDRSPRPAPAMAAPGPWGKKYSGGCQALRVCGRKSKELGVPPYTLFWDRTLDELCQRRPATAIELLAIWGIGEQKQRIFGAEILALVAAARG